MEEFYAHCYSVLGLSPGADPEEVRSAYRRLIKRYHPDHDKSAHAQTTYFEVRAAYESLHNRPVIAIPPPRRDTPPRQKAPPQKAAPCSRKSPFTRPAGKTPFSWTALPNVLWKSVNEVAGVQIMVRSALTCYILWSVIAPMTKTLAFFAMPLSLCGSAVFRYYYPRPPQDKGVYFFASLCYGVGLSAVFTVWIFFLELTWNFLLTKFVYHSLVFYTAILPLWIHPLIWTIFR
ncbi:MAG: J domain-containing protein [Synergistaceae bacterium]|jgi:hypothetical protein|nr:J domain-containing protein [Synergistaceae bacterium]